MPKLIPRLLSAIRIFKALMNSAMVNRIYSNTTFSIIVPNSLSLLELEIGFPQRIGSNFDGKQDLQFLILWNNMNIC